MTPCHPDYADTDTTGAAPTSGNTTAGRIIQPSTLCRLCGIPHKRHTAVSIAVASGADVLAVARMLGHADPSITLKRYAGLFDTGIDRVGESISAVMWRKVCPNDAHGAS